MAPSGERLVSPITCPFCENLSPRDAKFCSACGGALHLAPCPNCGAVNDVVAASCYQCHATLPGRKADEREAPVPAAVMTRLASGHAGYARIAAGVAAFVAVCALGYYAYQQRRQADSPSPIAVETTSKVIPGTAGMIKPLSAAEPARNDGNSGTESDVALPPNLSATATTPVVALSAPAASSSVPATSLSGSGNPPAAPARATPRRTVTSSSRAEQQTLESPQPKLGAAPPSIRQGECTVAVAALGLCQPQTTRTRAARSAAEATAPEAAQAAPAAKAPAAKPAPALARSAEHCTEAVAALGLCTPVSKVEAKGE